MKGLIKNEIKTFFSIKNIIIIVIFFLIMIPDVFKMKGDINNYIDTMAAQINSNQEMSKYYVNNLNYEIDGINLQMYANDVVGLDEDDKELEEEKKVKEAEVNHWKFFDQKLTAFNALTNFDKPDIDRYNSFLKEIDTYIYDEIYKKDFVSAYGENIYFYSKNQWYKRYLTEQVQYDDVRLKDPNYPDAYNALQGKLSGKLIYFAILLLLLNFDIWSNDYSSGAIKLYLTSPYSRKKLFYTRFITRLVLNLCVILLPLLFVFLYTGFKFGFLPQRQIVVNNLALNNIFKMPMTSDLSEIYALSTQGRVVGLQLLNIIIYTVFMFSLMGLISLLMKDNAVSIFFAVLFAYDVLFVTNLNPYNMPNYIKSQNLIADTGAYTFVFYQILMAVLAVAFMLGAKTVMEKRDIA